MSNKLLLQHPQTFTQTIIRGGLSYFISSPYESGVAISFAGAEGNRKKWVSDLRFALLASLSPFSRPHSTPATTFARGLILSFSHLQQDINSVETLH